MNEKIKVYDDKMQKTLSSLDGELGTIRAGRANPNILNRLTVEYYGTPTPIQQVANISVPEPRLIQIQPWAGTYHRKIRRSSRTGRRWSLGYKTSHPRSRRRRGWFHRASRWQSVWRSLRIGPG